MDIQKALGHIEFIETKMSELYLHLHKHFSDDREASGLFYTHSMEETGHADMVRYQQRLFKKSKLQFNDIVMDMDVIDRFIQLVNGMTSDPSLTLERALRLSVETEYGTAEHFRRGIIDQTPQEVASFLLALGVSDKEHIERLVRFAKSRGIEIILKHDTP